MPELKTKIVGITTKRGLDASHPFLKQLLKALEKRGVEVLICERTVEVLGEKLAASCQLLWSKKIDLLMVLGGDGTLLRVVQDLPDFNVPIVAVNLGTLGFLTAFSPEELMENLDKVLAQEYTLDKRLLQSIRVLRDGKEIHSYRALNDTVIAREALARVIFLPTEVDGQSLTTYVADGLIIATPTGSTAYSLSAGGPILHPELSAMILTPIAAHSLSQKPIVIPGGSTIRVHIQSRGSGVNLTVDGQIGIRLEHGDIVEICKDKQTFRFVRLAEDHFYQTLQNKIAWGQKNI